MMPIGKLEDIYTMYYSVCSHLGMVGNKGLRSIVIVLESVVIFSRSLVYPGLQVEMFMMPYGIFVKYWLLLPIKMLYAVFFFVSINQDK